MSEQQFEFKDFTVIARKVDDYWVEWEIFEIAGRGQNGEPVYMEDICIVDLEGKHRYAGGTIKWDGCSNWDFMTDDCAKHFCDTDDVQAMSDVVKYCYELTAKLCKKWNP